MTTMTYEEAVEARRQYMCRIIAHGIETQPGQGNLKIVDNDTWTGPHGETVTQPLDPEMWGFDVVYAEQVSPDRINIIRYDERNSDRYLRFEVMAPRDDPKWGGIQWGVYHLTLDIPVPNDPTRYRSEDRVKMSVVGISGIDVETAEAIARLLTLAAHIAGQAQAIYDGGGFDE